MGILQLLWYIIKYCSEQAPQRAIGSILQLLLNTSLDNTVHKFDCT